MARMWSSAESLEHFLNARIASIQAGVARGESDELLGDGDQGGADRFVSRYRIEAPVLRTAQKTQTLGSQSLSKAEVTALGRGAGFQERYDVQAVFVTIPTEDPIRILMYRPEAQTFGPDVEITPTGIEFSILRFFDAADVVRAAIERRITEVDQAIRQSSIVLGRYNDHLERSAPSWLARRAESIAHDEQFLRDLE